MSLPHSFLAGRTGLGGVDVVTTSNFSTYWSKTQGNTGADHGLTTSNGLVNQIQQNGTSQGVGGTWDMDSSVAAGDNFRVWVQGGGGSTVSVWGGGPGGGGGYMDFTYSGGQATWKAGGSEGGWPSYNAPQVTDSEFSLGGTTLTASRGRGQTGAGGSATTSGSYTGNGGNGSTAGSQSTWGGGGGGGTSQTGGQAFNWGGGGGGGNYSAQGGQSGYGANGNNGSAPRGGGTGGAGGGGGGMDLGGGGQGRLIIQWNPSGAADARQTPHNVSINA